MVLPQAEPGAPGLAAPRAVEGDAVAAATAAAASAASTASPVAAGSESSASSSAPRPFDLPSSVPAAMVGGAMVSAASGWASAGVVALLGLVAVLVPPLARTRLRVPVGLRPPSALLLAVERPG
jgi:hypothetical protein